MDQSTLIREKLAELLEKEEAWSKAAQVLAGIDLDSGGCSKQHCCSDAAATGLKAGTHLMGKEKQTMDKFARAAARILARLAPGPSVTATSCRLHLTLHLHLREHSCWMLVLASTGREARLWSWLCAHDGLVCIRSTWRSSCRCSPHLCPMACCATQHPAPSCLLWAATAASAAVWGHRHWGGNLQAWRAEKYSRRHGSTPSVKVALMLP